MSSREASTERASLRSINATTARDGDACRHSRMAERGCSRDQIPTPARPEKVFSLAPQYSAQSGGFGEAPRHNHTLEPTPKSTPCNPKRYAQNAHHVPANSTRACHGTVHATLTRMQRRLRNGTDLIKSTRHSPARAFRTPLRQQQPDPRARPHDDTVSRSRPNPKATHLFLAPSPDWPKPPDDPHRVAHRKPLAEPRAGTL